MEFRMKHMIAPLLAICALQVTVSAQEEAVLWITTTNEVHFVVIDPYSRRTGRDPRGSKELWVGTSVREIPKANYSFESVGDSPIDDSPHRNDVMHRFTYRFTSPGNDGAYMIDLFGIETGMYRFYLHVEPDDVDKIQRFETEERGLVVKGGLIRYRFEYHGQHGKTVRLSKNIQLTNIREDIAAAHQLSFLGDKKLFDDWNKELDKFERDLGKKDSAKARQELEKFGKEVDKLREETIKHEDKKVPKPSKFITQDAYQVIREDIDILLNQLPKK